MGKKTTDERSEIKRRKREKRRLKRVRLRNLRTREKGRRRRARVERLAGRLRAQIVEEEERVGSRRK